ncbi:MAG: hypothetical protein LBD01_00820 [Puniceicoccales bacterium]|nr:hypothetical protein [Puniceicoccales bacterium]
MRKFSHLVRVPFEHELDAQSNLDAWVALSPCAPDRLAQNLSQRYTQPHINNQSMRPSEGRSK